MDKNILDLYTDYLMTSTSLATATGLSEILDLIVKDYDVKIKC